MRLYLELFGGDRQVIAEKLRQSIRCAGVEEFKMLSDTTLTAK